MELSLAIAESCGPDSCTVRRLDGGRLTARYGAHVLNRVKVRPGDLVALDTGAEPPAVVWRWWHGMVESVDGDRATVSRNHTQPTAEHSRRRAEDLPVAPDLSGVLRPGDAVFFGGDAGVLDVAKGGLPAHPERLQALLPSVLAAYDSLGAT